MSGEYDEIKKQVEVRAARRNALRLLLRANWGWSDIEYGAPWIDPKRPYGNSDVEADVCKIMGWQMEGDDGDGPCWSSRQREVARALHRATLDALPELLRASSP